MGTHASVMDWPSHPGMAALRRAVPAGTGGLLAVAYSGGADSTALLLALWHLWPQRVLALHVNHGLQLAANDFERHVRVYCEELRIPLYVQHSQVVPARGDSVEEVARQARYRALADLARSAGADTVCLAQHQQDQAETLLLALTRGAGLPGLAGMPPSMQRHGVTFVRPWLEVSGPALRAWLDGQGVPYVNDPTNQDLRYSRNRIRQRLLPVLQESFPAYGSTLARSARHAAQAQGLLDELAAADLESVGLPPVISRLQGLSRARQANVLRYWLRQAGARQASEAQMEQALLQIAACTTRGHRMHIKVGQGFLLRQAERLRFAPAPRGSDCAL